MSIFGLEIPSTWLVKSLGGIAKKFLLSLFGKPSEWVGKKLFQPTYVKSHRLWHRRNCLGSHWETCNGLFEYSFFFPLAVDRESERIPKIEVRALGKDIQHLELLLEVESKLNRYQESISLANVTKKSLIKSMPNIPILDFLYINPDKGVLLFTWDTYKLSVIKLTQEDGNEFLPFTVTFNDMTHFSLMNSDWVHRWGEWWNLDAIKFTKEDIRRNWYRVIDPYGLYSQRRRLINRIAHVVLLRPFAWVMSREPALSGQFWVAIWFYGFKVDEDQYVFRPQVEKRPKHFNTTELT